LAIANVTSTTTADDLVVAAAVLTDGIVNALYENNHGLQGCNQQSIAGMPTKTYQFTKFPKLAATSVAEGVDLGYTAFSTNKVNITVGTIGIVLAPTDLLSVSQIIQNDRYATEAGKAIALKLTTDILALGPSLSTTVGPTTGNPLLESHAHDAVGTLEANSLPGPFAAFISPTQKKNLVADIGTTFTAAGTSGESVRASLNDLPAVRPDGMLSDLFGFPWYVTAAVPTINSGADANGAIVDVNRTWGYVEKWDVRVALQRDESALLTEIVTTATYGVGEVDDGSGLGVVSDA